MIISQIVGISKVCDHNGYCCKIDKSIRLKKVLVNYDKYESLSICLELIQQQGF